MQLFVYRRSLHPELFHIYLEKRIRRRRYEAQIWILGSSHLVSFFTNHRCITELTANENSLLPARGLLHKITMRRDREYQINYDSGLSYMITAQAEHMSENVYQHIHQEMLEFAERRGLFMSFNHWSGNGEVEKSRTDGSDGLVPFTFIDYESRPSELHICSYHAFPQQLAMLRTQSIFELI